MKTRIHALISGRVQGVYFRANTKKTADNLGVKGWVRNLPDGKVEVIAEGDKDKINSLIKFLKTGPERAKVDDLDIKNQDFEGEFEDFRIKY
jgi:acylphosphatase